MWKIVGNREEERVVGCAFIKYDDSENGGKKVVEEGINIEKGVACTWNLLYVYVQIFGIHVYWFIFWNGQENIFSVLRGD